MKIRKASYRDIDPVSNLIQELGYASNKEIITENITAYTRSGGYEIFVAEHEGTVVGCISLHVMRLFHMIGKSGRITSMVVSREHRGQGIGRALVGAADRYFESKGCVKAEVTSADYRKEAHRFYESEGFVLDARRFIKHYR